MSLVTLSGPCANLCAGPDTAGSAVKLLSVASAALTAAALLTGATGAPTAPLLREDFNRLDTTVWATCYQWQQKPCTNEWNHELQAYHPDKVRIRNGVLELTASRETRTGYLADGTPQRFDYASGMIRQLKPWMYGYVEMTAQLPTGRGLWPAFWLLPATYAWPPEIDIVEALGHEPNTIHYAVHRVDAPKSEHTLATSFRTAAGMHRYGLDWQPGRLTWHLDGRPVWTVTHGVPAEPMYLLANLAVGGDWPGPPDNATAFPASYRIDNITIWRQRP